MRMKFLGIALAIAASTFTLSAFAAEKPLAVELTGKKVITSKEGKESFESADKAKPGDLIEYKAVYRNKGKKKLTTVMAVIPVPAGTEYIAGSASPAQVSASLNGKEYAPVPLKRMVKTASGAEEMQDIPPAEYRFIRWELKSLSGGQSATVSIRVKIAQ